MSATRGNLTTAVMFLLREYLDDNKPKWGIYVREWRAEHLKGL